MVQDPRLTQHRLQLVSGSLSGSAADHGRVEFEFESANEDRIKYLFELRYLV